MSSVKKTRLLYSDTTESGYAVAAYRISATVDPLEYRNGYRQFYKTIYTNALPGTVDSSWTEGERRRVRAWQELLRLPSTHIIDVRSQEPKIKRKVITAYLRLSNSKVHPDSTAKRLADFVYDFLDSNADSPLLHPVLIDVSILAAIAGLWNDLRKD